MAIIDVFGYEVDTRLYELRRARMAINLEPKVFGARVYLLQHRDGIVSRQELSEYL